MLSQTPLKNHAGILIIGDYTSLRWMHEALHEVNNNSVLVKDKDESQLIAMAYEVRKAYEQQREIINPSPLLPEIGIRFGFRSTWPLIIFRSKLFRESLGFFDSSKKQQAVAFTLEALIEEGLNQQFGPKGYEIISWWRSMDLLDFNSLHCRNAIFCHWSKSERKRLLGKLIASFNIMHEDHYQARAAHGEKDLIAPQDLQLWENLDTPDPRW
jgi:hypothetical protein